MLAELISEGEFQEMVPEQCKPLPPQEQFKKIIASNKAVLALNPNEEASKQMVQKLESMNCEFT